MAWNVSNGNRIARRKQPRAPARRIGPEQARVVAALVCPLGAALLARMAHWPVAGVVIALAAVLLVLCVHLLYALRPQVMRLASARQLSALTPLEFEHHVAAWFRERGYRVEHCGAFGKVLRSVARTASIRST